MRVTYRPFDDRWMWYQPDLIQIGRGGASPGVMRNLITIDNNLALLTSRNSQSPSFSSAFCTRHISEMKTAESTRASYCFPLFVCTEDSGGLFCNGRRANLSPVFLEDLHRSLQLETESVTAEQVISFIYSILYSPTYRIRYREFLKIDFPHIPIPTSISLFGELACVGGELIALHLLESPLLDHFITTYIGPKKPEVVRVGWSDNTVWFDATATRKGQPATPGTIGFRGVPEEVWNFHIGGYQVCEKWLKDRKGRVLSEDDIAHYQKIVVAINETIRVMKEIDEVIERHGGWPDAFLNKSAAAENEDPEGSAPSSVSEKQDQYVATKQTTAAKKPPFPKNNWKVWLNVAKWIKETKCLNSYWIDFGHTISTAIKNHRTLNDKQVTEMKKLWDMAVKKGFRA